MSYQKGQALINFKKVRSVMDKLIEMSERNVYCIDIMQQNLAAIGLLKSAHQLLMEGHLSTCFKTAMQSNQPAKQRKMTQEILQVTKLAQK